MKPVSGHPQLQLAEDEYIRASLTAPLVPMFSQINIQFVSTTCHYDDGMELVVVKLRTSMGLLMDLFPINSPKNIEKIPLLMEGLCNGMPLNLCIGCHNEFVPKFINNSIAYLPDHFRNGVWC